MTGEPLNWITICLISFRTTGPPGSHSDSLGAKFIFPTLLLIIGGLEGLQMNKQPWRGEVTTTNQSDGSSRVKLALRCSPTKAATQIKHGLGRIAALL